MDYCEHGIKIGSGCIYIECHNFSPALYSGMSLYQIAGEDVTQEEYIEETGN